MVGLLVTKAWLKPRPPPPLSFTTLCTIISDRTEHYITEWSTIRISHLFIYILSLYFLHAVCILTNWIWRKVNVICWCLFFCQAYIFRDYWEDIGTIKSYYDASLALTEEVCFIVFKTDIFEFHIGLIPIHNFMKCTLIAHDKRILTPKDIMTLAQMAFPLRRGWNLES